MIMMYMTVMVLANKMMVNSVVMMMVIIIMMITILKIMMNLYPLVICFDDMTEILYDNHIIVILSP